MAQVRRFVICSLGGLLFLAGGCAVGPRSAAQAPVPPRSATLPFILDHNRMVVEVEFLRPDGSVRRADAWVDTGNQYLILAEPLARDLGVDVPTGETASADGHSVAMPSPAPPMRLRGLSLDVTGIPVRVHPGSRVRPGVRAEANLPASALRHEHVVFDYPAGRLTVARPGVLRPRGVAVPCRVNQATGLFQISATVDGETVELGVDNGSAGTWVSATLVEAILRRHPDRAHASGAVGSTNFFGFDFEVSGTLVRLPVLGLGSLRARDVAVLGLDQRMFDWYSQKTAGPVAGFVGANVLRGYRVEIDYPHATTYWEAGAVPATDDLDVVGLTLRPEGDGGFSVAGVVAKDGEPVVAGVEPGDRLVRVDSLDATGARMGEVVDALRGVPGSVRTLLLERDGRRFTVQARVVRLP